MGLSARLDRVMGTAIASAQGGPSRLSSALEYAVTPGGARIRPTILVSVALACGDDQPALTDAAAAALELMHCASLVHDDLPCFDDAATRRGKPSVHRAYSEPLAVLTGDSLIIHCFHLLSSAAPDHPNRSLRLIQTLSRLSGSPHGICAGQGWESESKIDLAAYHRAKTGALFVAATQMGAIAAGQDAEPWEELGARIGEAFQVADDIRDAVCTETELGKPIGQDDRHGRPNAVAQFGISGAVQRLDDILSGAISSIPHCPGEAALAQMVKAYADRLVPAAARDRRTVPGE